MLFPAVIVRLAVVMVIGSGAAPGGRVFSGAAGGGVFSDAGPMTPSQTWGRSSQPGQGVRFGIDDQASGIDDQGFDIDDQISGISGTVYRLSGNHMPAPNRHAHPTFDSGRVSGADSFVRGSFGARPGVKATVCIFELTSINQVVPSGGNSGSAGRGRPAGSGGSSPYYQAVLTHLIRQVDTDDKGYFQVALPPGTYSVFTKKGDLFYATQRDEKNNIAPVKVLPGKITRIQCSVESDHSVVY
ncbi:MAG TPA: hypothetical protein VGN00_01435 [Puia sp.]|jgi:hypothetical protein